MFNLLKRIKSGSSVSWKAKSYTHQVEIIRGYQTLMVIVERYQHPSFRTRKIGRRTFMVRPKQSEFWATVATVTMPLEFEGLLEEAIRGNRWYFLDAMEEAGAPVEVLQVFQGDACYA